MKTKAVRLYGEMDLRLDEFELPEMQDDEIYGRGCNRQFMYVQLQAITQAQNTKKYQMISVKSDHFRTRILWDDQKGR